MVPRSNPAFLAAFEGFDATECIEGWPLRVEGDGAPCNPRGLEERRFALRAGASALPKALAQDLDVRLQTLVTRLERVDDRMRVHLQDGGVLDADDVLVALPNAQTSALLATLEPSRQVDGVRFLLGRAAAVPCLTLLALYPPDTPDPGFDVWLPEQGPASLISQDSTKRVDPTHRALVLQGTPAWSATHLEEDPATWSSLLLEFAAGRLGPWVKAPVATHTHRWRYARLDPAWAFHGPVVLGADRARVVLAGEAFHEGTGVQGAFLAGQRAAARLLENR